VTFRGADLVNVQNFAAPTWPDIDMKFDLAATAVATALETAANARAYSEPHGRDSLGYLRLGGTVYGRNVALTAKPYVTPGIPTGRSLTLHLSGSVVDAQLGSRLVGKLSAPTPRFIPLLLGAWVLFLLITASNPLATAVLFAPMLPAWWLIGRYNQRQALRHMADVERFLVEIVESRRATLPNAD
jgi:hypothetical protein